jgi:hypothetical protein
MGFMSFARILGPSFSGIRYEFDWSSRVIGFDSLVFLFEKFGHNPWFTHYLLDLLICWVWDLGRVATLDYMSRV